MILLVRGRLAVENPFAPHCDIIFLTTCIRGVIASMVELPWWQWQNATLALGCERFKSVSSVQQGAALVSAEYAMERGQRHLGDLHGLTTYMHSSMYSESLTSL